MTASLPTLKGLRAFEEAYWHGSFTLAAKALNVQQPAISYQIKQLEQDLGVVLFEKKHGRLVPTPDASELYETVSRAFRNIRTTAARIRAKDGDGVFTVATYPGIGTYWLSSRLPDLSEQLGAQVKVITLVKDADLFREPADCWILFGQGHWPGFEARKLIDEAVCPVASPSLIERYRKLDGSIDVSNIPLIEQDDPERRWLSWEAWLDRSEDDWRLSDNRVVVNDHGMALHLALSGVGVALGWMGIIQDLIDGKSLVPMSPHHARSDFGYWVLGREGFWETTQGRLVMGLLKN